MLCLAGGLMLSGVGVSAPTAHSAPPADESLEALTDPESCFNPAVALREPGLVGTRPRI